MRTDIPIPAVDQNGLPFDVWLNQDGATLRDKEGATYRRLESSDDPDGLGFVDDAAADSPDVILVPRIDFHGALGTSAVLRRYEAAGFQVLTDGRITNLAGETDEPSRQAAELGAVGHEPGWDVFEADDRYEIERDDDASVFETDEPAIAAAVAYYDQRQGQPVPAPSKPPEPPHYFVQCEGDAPQWLTLAEIEDQWWPLSDPARHALAVLTPGQEHYDHDMGAVITRPKRVRALVAFEFDACDAADPQSALESMLDGGTPQDELNGYEGDNPLHVTQASIDSITEIQ